MAKIYRKRGNKLNEVVTFDSACTRQENQPLVYDATDGSVHTTTHIGCLNADDVSVGNLTVTGQAIIQEQVTDTIDSNTLVLRSNADAGLTGTENSGAIIHNYNGSEDLYAVTDNTGTFRVGTAVSTTTTYAYLRYNKADNKWYSTAPGVTPTIEVTPVGSPTSWDSVVTSGDDVEYTNIVFSVIDRTSLQPLTTRDESTDMEKDYLTKWNSTNEKIITTGTSCTHDLCANGDITSTGDITADGNVCVKTNITVDGNSCVSGDSTVSGEIHSCKCITAPTACVSDDLYVAGDINNCNTDSIFHGFYGCFEKNVCIKGDLAIDGTIAVSSLTSDHVISVENTTNSPFYLPFVQNNHLVKGANDLYTNGDLQYNPSTDVLCTKTFCSDRGIVQSAISGVTAANLGLTANTVYDLSTIVSCLQACCGNKAVSYSFEYKDASTPKVAEYGNDYAYNFTFEKLDNNDLSGTWSKTRWLVTGENGVSWTVTGNTTSTAGSATWTVCEHVVDQVCVATAGGNLAYPLIFSTCQPTPSCSKKTLFTDSANQLMYNPSTNTLKTCCVCACCDSYHARIKSPNGNTLYATITLNPDSLGENTAHLTFDVYGTKFELGVKEIASNSTKMSITYFTKTGDYGITCANVINANNKNVVYIKYSGYRNINITSDIPITSITKSSAVPSDVSSTSWCEPTYDNATQYVNVTDTNNNFPILFNSCQATPAAGCKTLYNDSANNLMYNPGTNTMSVPNVNASGTVCAATFCGNFCGPLNGKATNLDASGVDVYPVGTCSARLWSSTDADSYGMKGSGADGWAHHLSMSHGDYDTYFGLSMTLPFWENDRFRWRVRNSGDLCPVHELIDDRGGQTIAGNLTVHNSSNNAVLTADYFNGNFRGCINFNDVADANSYDVSCGDVVRKVYSRSSISGSGYRQSIAIGHCRPANNGWGTAFISVGTSDNNKTWVDFDFDPAGYICAPAGYKTSTGLTLTSSTSTPISLTCGSYNLTIDNRNSIAIGKDASAGGASSIGIGHLSSAAQTSVAIGACSNALTGNSVAIGTCSCSQTYAVAIGCKAKATYYSVSIGCAADSSSDYGVAIGPNAKNCVQSGIAIGSGANTSGYGSACVLVDERAGGRMRRSIICWNTSTKQCNLFCAIYCRFNFNYYDNSSTVYVGVTGTYGNVSLNEIKWDKNESPMNFDLGRHGFTNVITVYSGCTSTIPKAGYVQIVGYAR